MVNLWASLNLLEIPTIAHNVAQNNEDRVRGFLIADVHTVSGDLLRRKDFPQIQGSQRIEF
jgi:hypothetical protein